MKKIYLSFVLLMVVMLAACGQPAAPAPTPTPVPPTATVAPPPSSTPLAVTPAAQGGIEAALALVTVPNQENIALVDDEAISIDAYREELTRALYMVTSQYGVDWNDPQNQALLPMLQEQVLDQVIERVVLQQLARKEDLSIGAKEIEAEVTALQTSVQSSGQFADWAAFLTANGLTDESLRALITADLISGALSERHAGSTSAEQVHASHILVETEEIGQQVLAKLAKGEAFAGLAAEYSTDTGSKDLGGDLGWFPRGVMVSEFEQVAFTLEISETSQLVKTDFGYHIILVHEKETRELDPALLEQLQEQQFQTWFDEQQAAMTIKRLYVFHAP